MSDHDETVTLRNDVAARFRGGPAGISVERGETVTVDDDHADFYVDTHDFTVVDESESAAAADEAAADVDLDAMDYREKQQLAAEYDAVDGSADEVTMTEQLRDALESGGD
jgi:hypothetical protein